MKTEKLKKVSLISLIIILSASNIATAKSQKPNKEEELNYFHHSSIFDDDFYTHFAKIEKQIEEQRKQHRKLIEAALKEAKENPNTTRTSLISSDDEENYFYQLNFSKINKDDILVALEGNILSFSYSKKQENKNQKTAANFYYSFSVANFDNSTKPEITRLEDKIIVKLKKKK